MRPDESSAEIIRYNEGVICVNNIKMYRDSKFYLSILYSWQAITYFTCCTNYNSIKRGCHHRYTTIIMRCGQTNLDLNLEEGASPLLCLLSYCLGCSHVG